MTCLLDTGRGDETFVRCCDGRRCSGFREGGEIRHPHRGELARNPRLAGECFPLRGERARVPGPRFTPAYAVLNAEADAPRSMPPLDPATSHRWCSSQRNSLRAQRLGRWPGGRAHCRNVLARCVGPIHTRTIVRLGPDLGKRPGRQPIAPGGKGNRGRQRPTRQFGLRRLAHPSCHRPHSITAVCARLDELAVVRDADQWTRVTGKEDDGAGAEDGIVGAPLETELREIRGRQGSIGVREPVGCGRAGAHADPGSNRVRRAS